MANKKVKVGVVGCGNISKQYFDVMPKFGILDVAACADLDLDRAKAAAGQYGIGRACTTKELLADPEIEIVLNITIPAAHTEVALAALEAGKHVYNEKPLTISREDGKRVLDVAGRKGLLVGCAPDTVLGGGHQTCRKLIDDGAIGEPIAATAFMMCHGHESWHPAPEFYYKAGGGPMLDMGPYYLTSLVMLMGPVRRLSGSARRTFATRTITSQPLAGQVISVDVPTHVAGVMDFACGAVGSIVMSFDVWAHTHSRIEIYGTEGSMLVPDPNGFGGPVKIKRGKGGEWDEVAVTHPFADRGLRGLGVADMATAIRTGRPHRASGALAYHVLDVMHAFHDASDRGRHIELTSGCERPAALPENATFEELD